MLTNCAEKLRRNWNIISCDSVIDILVVSKVDRFLITSNGSGLARNILVQLNCKYYCWESLSNALNISTSNKIVVLEQSCVYSYAGNHSSHFLFLFSLYFCLLGKEESFSSSELPLVFCLRTVFWKIISPQINYHMNECTNYALKMKKKKKSLIASFCSKLLHSLKFPATWNSNCNAGSYLWMKWTAVCLQVMQWLE